MQVVHQATKNKLAVNWVDFVSEGVLTQAELA